MSFTISEFLKEHKEFELKAGKQSVENMVYRRGDY